MNSNIGYLKVMLGNMNSGKTTSLLTEMEKFNSHNTGSLWSCLYINSAIDQRSEENCSVKHPLIVPKLSKCDSMKVKNLKEVRDKIKNYHVIGVDEAQFFDDLEEVLDWVSDNKIVIVVGLSSDSDRNKFGKCLDLIPNADEFIQLRAICSICASEGKFNPGAFTMFSGQKSSQISIGDSQYISVCRHHHIQHSV